MLFLVWLAVILLFIFGLVGVFAPGLPGIGLIFLGILLYAWVTGFSVITWSALIVFGLLALLATVADYLGAAVGARAGGGKLMSVIGAVLGLLIGTVTFGPLGLIAGTFVGAVIGSLLVGHNTKQAVKAATWSIIGIVGGTLIQLIFAISLIISFFILIIF